MSYTNNADAMEFFGQVVAWLRSAPAATKGYGTFGVARVVLDFDGEPIGEFVPDHMNAWVFNTPETLS